MSLSPPGPPSGPQVIPRPPAARLGGPAPWAELSHQARRHLTLDRVRGVIEGLASNDVGTSGDREIAESIRSISGIAIGANPAAVLVSLFEEDGEARVILTVRSSRLRSHQGEVAFPGGRLDAGESVDEGARREAYEEIRLDPTSVDIIGHLAAMPTVSSNTMMTPVVAILARRPTLFAGPDEVARIFDVALSELLEEGVFVEEWWSVPGRPVFGGSPGSEFPVWFFHSGGEIIWGATARVLVELLCLTLGLPGPFSW